MELNTDKILAEKILLALKVDYDQTKLAECTAIIREYRTEIEKEFAKNYKRTTNIDQDFPIIRMSNRHQAMDGQIEGSIVPRLSNENQFDNPERIAED